jgi:hypothetical protein
MPARIALPAGAGTPFPEFLDAYRQATSHCAGVKTISASLSLSGHAGKTKIAARIDAGFAEPADLRLEGFPRISFGGKPFFVLVSHAGDATLVLPRDGRVLRGAPPSAILEALAGVALDPAELRAIVAGCGLSFAQPSAGQSFPNGWAALDTADATLFLRRLDGPWRVAAARKGPITIEYADFTGGRPATVRVRTTPQAGAAAADLTIRLSQIEINTPLERAVFDVDVPPDAVPITLEELRRAGPLGGS